MNYETPSPTLQSLLLCKILHLKRIIIGVENVHFDNKY